MAGKNIDDQAIFEVARKIDSREARQSYLQQVCGEDPALQERISALLSAYEENASFLEAPHAGIQATEIRPVTELPGELIGPYKLLEQIGEGGFGIVYMADQQSPVRRRVALKIIKPGMDTRQVLARFDAERQALALMDHPNIAHALDAGATDSGRPYFVMELVRGVPITEYCDQNNLAVHERLDLFVQVCHAVQHAHQKGIIHRDIKPSNILVTMSDGRPVPKVIDFGVAKAINQQLTQETIFTRFAEMIGTPLYMSPEQAEMTSLDIDTRSDIYSLGVVLYELLTGSTPFEKQRLKQAAFDEIRRIIREEEPAKPSTRISTLGDKSAVVAAHRHADPRRLGQQMRGDLDWIVMKALEKDRTRRYETANGLAMDIQRHLADEPVLAGPPSALYRFQKFARRNRTPLAMAAVVTIALLLGIVGTAWQAIRATRQREQAEANFQQARQAVDEYFTIVSESKLLDVPGLQPLRKELLEAAMRYYEKFAVERTDDPAVLADLAVTQLRVAEVYLTMNRSDDSLASIVHALDVIDRLRGDYPAATEHQRRLAGYWKGFRPAHKTQYSMPRGGMVAAVKTFERLVDTWQKLAEDNPTEIGFQSDLAAIDAHLGMVLDFERPEQAAIFSEKAQRILETLVRQYPKVPEYRADLARVNETLVGTYFRSRRFADSEAAYRRNLQLCEELVADFPNVPQYRVDLTINLHQLGNRVIKADTKRGAAAFRRAIELAKGLTTEFPAVPLYRSLLTGIASELFGLARQPGSHQQEAEKLYRELMPVVTQLAAENPVQAGEVWQLATASNYVELAKLLDKGGQREEAEKAYRQGIAMLEKLAADHPGDRITLQMLVQSYQLVGPALSAAGRTQEAGKVNQRLLELLQKLAIDFPSEADVQHALGMALHGRGRLEEAETCFRKEIEIDPRKNSAHHELGSVLRDRGRLEEAEACYRKELEIDPRRVWSLHDLGLVLRDRGRPDEAEACFRKVIEIEPTHFWSHFLLGDMLFAAGKKDEAVACYRNVIEINPQEEWVQQKARSFLIAHGSPGEVEAGLRKAIETCEKLAADHPGEPARRHELANRYSEFGNLLADAGRLPEAETAFHHSMEIYEMLASDFPANSSYREGLGHIARLLAGRLNQVTRSAEREALWRRAAKQFEQSVSGVADIPSSQQARFYLADTYRTLADELSAQSRHVEAEKLYHLALDHFEKLVAESPSNADYRWYLAGSREAMAGLLMKIGRKGDAETQRRDALALWEKLVAESPTNIDYRWHLAVAHDALGGLLKDAGRLHDAAEAYSHALPLWEKLSAETHSDDHRMHLSWTRGWLIGVLLQQNKHAEAAKLAVEFARASPDKSESLRAAVFLDQCAALAQKDASLTPADIKAASDAYAKQAAELMSEAGKRVAGNGQLENQLAWGLVTNPKPELRSPARAVELSKKAVELAPTAGYIWNTLGIAQYRAGDWKSAIAALEKSMELRNGGDSGDWFFVAMAYWQLGEKDLAQKWYEAATLWMARHSPKNDEYKQFRAEAATLIGLPETEPADAKDELALGEILVDVHPRPSSYMFRGGALANSDQWARAADDYTKAIELGEKSYPSWYTLALIRRAQDDKPAYQAACVDVLKQFAQTDDAQTANFVAWTCALGPDAFTDFAPAVALAEKSIKKDPKSAQFANTLGAILYRAGRFDEARQKLEEADRLEMSANPRLSTPAYTWFFLAMTNQRLGHADKAREWLDKACQATDKALKEHEAGTVKLAWNRRLTLNLLRREAEQDFDFQSASREPAAVHTIDSAAPVVAPKPRNVSEDN